MSGPTRLIHKASILSILFQSGFDKLAVDRLLRVRCYTRDFRKPNPNSADILDHVAVARASPYHAGETRHQTEYTAVV